MMDAKERADLRARMREAWEDHGDDGRVIITMKDARVLVEDVLAPVPKLDINAVVDAMSEVRKPLYNWPNAQHDWSLVDEVIVYYPMPSRKVKMRYHGRLHSNPDMCIVEDEHGNIHVVSKSILWFERD